MDFLAKRRKDARGAVHGVAGITQPAPCLARRAQTTSLDAAVGDDVCSLLLGHVWNTLLADAAALDVDILTWRVLNLCNSLLTPTFAE